MRMLIPLVLAAAILGACDRTPRATPLPSATVEPRSGPPLDGSVIAARLAAALEISGSRERDTALQSVAQEAASSRSIDVMKNALDRISSSSEKDRAAAACAAALVKAGDPAAAKDAAMLISGSSERDAVLSRIATGK